MIPPLFAIRAFQSIPARTISSKRRDAVLRNRRAASPPRHPPFNLVMGFADPTLTVDQLSAAGLKRISVGGAMARHALCRLPEIRPRNEGSGRLHFRARDGADQGKCAPRSPGVSGARHPRSFYSNRAGSFGPRVRAGVTTAARQFHSRVVSSISHPNMEWNDISRGDHSLRLTSGTDAVNSTIRSQGALNRRHSSIHFIASRPGRGYALGFDCTFPAAITLER